jgi:D-alanine-D-alanine ligase
LPVCAHSHTTQAAVDLAGGGEIGLRTEAARVEGDLSYPMFVKPANMGSSVGVTKVLKPEDLPAAVELALRYDKRVICEKMVYGRELEIGVIGNGEPLVSAVGEILSEAEYYDYDSKYRGGGTKLSIPADLPEEVTEEIEGLAKRAYAALGGEGFARIDLFYDEAAGRIFLSEMNAIPGFTKYSMFPLLWGAKSVGYAELIERIIGLGYERHHAAHRR